MNAHEPIGNFFSRQGQVYDESADFLVYRMDETQLIHPSPFTRRAYYKIALLQEGQAILTYADRTIPIGPGTLIFSNPLIPYAYQRISEKQTYCFCLFTPFFADHRLLRESPAESSLFSVQGDHVLFPSPAALERIEGLFESMLQEAAGDYPYKDDVQRNHVQLLIHEALKIAPPSKKLYTPTTSAQRITELFMMLLARQFPIAAPQDRMAIRTSAGFAAQLAVHVNYLNKSVRQVTGRTTTALISEQVVNEARALLQHTSWDVAEIGYCLGFDHASNFNSFFRRMTGEAPNRFRKERRP